MQDYKNTCTSMQYNKTILQVCLSDMAIRTCCLATSHTLSISATIEWLRDRHGIVILFGTALTGGVHWKWTMSLCQLSAPAPSALQCCP